MDSKLYKRIHFYCKKKLVEKFQNRHLEDLTQHVAMRHFETEGKGSWEWFVADYCRENGITQGRGKMGAKAMENATFVGLQKDESEEKSEGNFLLEQYASDNAVGIQEDEGDTTRGVLEELLYPLDIKSGAMKWATKTYQSRLNSNRYNTSMSSSS